MNIWEGCSILCDVKKEEIIGMRPQISTFSRGGYPQTPLGFVCAPCADPVGTHMWAV